MMRVLKRSCYPLFIKSSNLNGYNGMAVYTPKNGNIEFRYYSLNLSIKFSSFTSRRKYKINTKVKIFFILIYVWKNIAICLNVYFVFRH